MQKRGVYAQPFCFIHVVIAHGAVGGNAHHCSTSYSRSLTQNAGLCIICAAIPAGAGSCTRSQKCCLQLLWAW